MKQEAYKLYKILPKDAIHSANNELTRDGKKAFILTDITSGSEIYLFFKKAIETAYKKVVLDFSL